MNNESVRHNDPLQLQQMVLFLRAELTKYKNEVNRLRDSDYYSLVLRLERENVQLTNRKKELSMELVKLKRDFEKKTNDYHEDIQMREDQRKKHIASIEVLLKEKHDLRTENKQLVEAIKATKDEFIVYQRDGQERMEADYKASIKNFENQLIDFTQETSKQIDAILEELEKNRRALSESDYVKKYLMKELEEKSNKIERLLEEIASLTEKDRVPLGNGTSSSSEKAIVNAQILAHLDTQVKKVLAQSIDFEKQLDKKLSILHDLEQKLNQLSIEIEDKS